MQGSDGSIMMDVERDGQFGRPRNTFELSWSLFSTPTCAFVAVGCRGRSDTHKMAAGNMMDERDGHWQGPAQEIRVCWFVCAWSLIP
jgi:hypothetical protein